MAQKVSDILKKQDAFAVRGVEQILVALQARYPQNLEPKSAIRDMQDLAKLLDAVPPKPAQLEKEGLIVRAEPRG